MTYSCPFIFLSYQISKAEFYGKSARTDDQRTVRTSHGPTVLSKQRPVLYLQAWHAQEFRGIVRDQRDAQTDRMGTGAAPDEIRLLEVNDRFAGSDEQIDAVDFGVDVGGKPVRLFVADITSDQLVRVKQDPSQLPTGWSIIGARHWGRQAA